MQVDGYSQTAQLDDIRTAIIINEMVCSDLHQYSTRFFDEEVDHLIQDIMLKLTVIQSATDTWIKNAMLKNCKNG